VVGQPPASAATIQNVTRTAAVRLAPGITQYHERFRTSDGYAQSAWLTRVDLTVRGTRLGVAASHNLVNSGGETVLAMAQRTRAVAGVNGDLFDFGRSGAPYGGEIVGGRILKSPVSSRVGQLAVLANGKVVLGRVAYSGSVTRTDRPTVKHSVTVNNIRTARSGGVTLVTPALGRASVRAGCVLATGTQSRGVDTVARQVVTGRTIARLAAGHFALLGCDAGRDWLTTYARAGRSFRPAVAAHSPAYPAARVVSALQGARMVVRHGAAYTDRSTTWHTSGHNPETFVCVAKNRTTVLLGTVDGRQNRAVGVTFPQVTAYLLLHGCYDGLVLDGGGSTTTVGSTSAGSPLMVRNVPAWGGQTRPIANGLFAYRR
jgi:exopolysaccharide biosynthesis protein